MAQIILEVPDSILSRVLDSYAKNNGYQGLVALDGTAELVINPESKQTFMERDLLTKIAADVANDEATVAAHAKRVTVEAELIEKLPAINMKLTEKEKEDATLKVLEDEAKPKGKAL